MVGKVEWENFYGLMHFFFDIRVYYFFELMIKNEDKEYF